MGCTAARGGTARAGNVLDLQDHDRFYRRFFLNGAVRTRGNIADPFYHVHAVDHAAEDRVTPARGIGIECGVIV